ncbi:hypothetical protein [Carboxylicivirga sp. N1Y90]|uniref:hypothetical protein n=1 Tax=Carboxylicivirga fragile TaxID=3417571 RepID=UPI003D3369F8|nr:hypothetical protein [Marinilabiliaceae bacterium N1Y90]
MKELKQFFYLVLVVLATATMSCTKEGPQGEAGKDGKDGIDGTNGTDGANGNSTCMECHNDESDLFLKQTQFEHSTHFVDGPSHVGYANYAGGSCSMCHSNEGFLTAVANDNNSGGSHPEATPMSCGTCHQIHKTYTTDDYKMHYTKAVDMYLNENDVFTGLEVDATSQYSDPNGMSNTCIKCHQPRHRGDTQPDPTVDGTLEISAGAAAHWGPHYGAQGAIFGGVGGYVGTTDPTAPSGTKGHHSCKSCHMSFIASTGNYGEYLGGHAMGLRKGDDTVEFGACNTCHTDRGATIDLEGIMASTKALHALLGQDLMDAGIMDAEGHLIGGTWTNKELAAYWNYALVKNDHSYGIHNKEYSESLITAGRAYLGTNN